MPQCSVCSHPDRLTVEKSIVAGGSYRDVAGRFGLTKSSVERHADSHLPARLVKAQDRQDTREAINVLDQLKAINQAALAVLRDARASGDGELTLKAIDRVQKQIELQAKLLGDLDDRPQINVTLSAEWVELRVIILNALSGHPEAKLAVVEALSAHAG